MGPKIRGNPLYISVYLLVFSYFFGEFILPKYHLLYLFNLLGLLGLIISVIFSFQHLISLTATMKIQDQKQNQTD